MKNENFLDLTWSYLKNWITNGWSHKIKYYGGVCKNVAYCSKNTFDSSMQYATISFPSLKRGA